MRKFTLIFMLLICLRGFAQLPLEDFEGTWTSLSGTSGSAGPSGWYIRNDAGPIQRWVQADNSTYPAHSGTHTALINRENVTDGTTTNDWLITPVFTVPLNAQLKFWSRLTLDDDQGTVYKIFIGTDPTDTSTFTEIQSWTELQINPDQLTFTEKIVNIPTSYTGSPFYIAFVMQGDNGDRWLIDDVQVAENCLVPTALTATPSATSAVLTWAGNAPNFEIEVLPATATPTQSGVTVPGNTYTTPTTLTPSTNYVYYIRSVCSGTNFSAWAGPFAFTTTQIPATLNLIEDFEAAATEWSFVNSGQVNQWVISNAAPLAVNAGSKSLYITNNTTTNAYAYTNTVTSVSHAYRDITIPANAEQLSLSFNWKCYGELNYDYFRVWLAPVTYNPVAGAEATTGTAETQIAGNFLQNSNWATYNGTINATGIAGTTRRLVFEWRNDNSSGITPPAAIDNVNLSLITCPTPSNLTLVSTNQNSANFTWTAPTTVTPNYDFYFSPINTAPTASTSATATVPNTSLTLNSLAPLTTYYIWIRSNCGSGDTSAWIGPLAFTTTQVPATLPYTQDFEGASGFAFNTVTTSQNRWITGTATSNGGTRSLYVTNDGGATNAYTSVANTYVHAFRDIAIPTGANEISVTFDWKSLGETNDYMRVWVVPTTYLPVGGTQMTTTNGTLLRTTNFTGSNTWTNYGNNVNVSAFAGRMCRLVFEWTNNGFTTNQPPAAVDNLNVQIVTCPRPTDLTASSDGSTAQLSWTPGGTETQWEVYVTPATGGTVPSASTVGTIADTNVNFVYTPLLPVTTYNYYVRAICSDSDKSLWMGPYTFTTPVLNDNCSGATPLTVSPTETCTSSVAGSFLGAYPSTLPACSGIAGPDVWYSFVATGSSNIVSIADVGPTFVNNSADPTRPLVITVYENECGDLNPIGCSIQNYLRVKDLVPGQTYFVRVTQSSASPSAAVTYSICVTTPPAPTSGNASECLITTINYSFENPIRTTPVGNLNPIMYSDNQIQGWRTTANDHVMEFWPTPNSENVLAYEGTQFIEINANANQGVMGVYQDFATPSPTTFTIKFAHRGRRGTDSMEILAGDASQSPSTYTTRVGNVIFSSGNTAWSYYGADNSLTYTVPAGQTVTRFFFKAVSTATGDTSVGNFLDAITFTADNSIITTSPVAANCVNNVITVDARGDGNWVAHTDNPSATTIANSRANNTNISGFNAPGTYYYDWVTAYCTSTLEVTYSSPAIALPTTTQDTYTYCAGETATTLSATGDTGFVLHWYDVATGGTELTGGAPTPSTTTPGTFMYYVSQSNGSCEGPRLPFTITVNAVPVAPVDTASVTYCINAAATQLSITPDTGATLNWYTDPVGGTASATAPTPDTSVVATTLYYVSQTSAEGCEGPRTTVTVTVTNALTQPTSFTLPASVCIAGTNPTATPDAGTTLNGAFTSSNPTALVINPVTGVIDLSSSTPGVYDVTYTLLADPTNCLALSSSTQQITVTPLSAPELNFTYATVCEAAANIMPNPTNPGFITGGTYTSSDPTLLVVELNTGEINIAASTPGTYSVTYATLVDPTTCTDAGTITVPVTINALAVPNTTYFYNPICGLETTLNPQTDPNFVTGGVFSSTAGLDINSDGVINVGNSTPGTYTVLYNLAQNDASCQAAAVDIAATVVITAPNTAITGFNYTNTSVCSNDTSSLVANLDLGFTTGGSFSATPAGLSINATTGEINIASSTPGVYAVVYSVGSNLTTCTNGGTSAAVTITITPTTTPVAGFTYSTNYCYGTTTVMPSTDLGFDTTGTFTVSGGLTINPSTGELNLSGATPGQYTVTYNVLANPSSCSLPNSASFTFTLQGSIEFALEGNCEGPSYIISSAPVNNSFDPELVSYEWTNASGTTVGDNSSTLNVSQYLQTVTSPTFPMTFNLTVTAGSCYETLPYVVDGITCQIQRGISPGGTVGQNDYFDLSGFGVKKLSIFNRYGLEVYSRNNYINEWYGQTNNGDELPTGTYFYMIDSESAGQKTGWIYVNRAN